MYVLPVLLFPLLIYITFVVYRKNGCVYKLNNKEDVSYTSFGCFQTSLTTVNFF